MVPFEAFLSEKPVLTTTDAGGPLDIVHDRETGLVVAPQRRGARARVRVAARARGRGARVRPRRARASRARVTWDSCIDRLLAAVAVKVAYFSPLPPATSGIADYSALLLPALERLVEVEVVRPGRTRPVADADVALYHIGNDPDAHGWIVDALRRRPGVVVLHDFVIHHLVAGLTIGRHDGHAYLAAMEREAGVARTAARLRRARGPRAAALGGAAARSSRSPARCSTARRASSSTRTTSRRTRASTATTGRSGASRIRRGRRPSVEPAARRRRAADRLLRAPEREQAHPAAAARVRGAAARRIPARACCSSARRRPASTSRAGSSGIGLDDGRRDPRAVRRGGAALVADGGVRRVRAAARADDGRDVGQRDPDALARQAARRQRRRLVRRAARRRRAEGSRRRRRGGRRARRRRCARLADPGVAATRWARPRARTSSGSTTSTASPSSTPPRSRRPPAARAVRERVLREVAEAAADVGVDAGAARAGARARPRSSRRTDVPVRATSQADRDRGSCGPGRCGPGSRRSTPSRSRPARARRSASSRRGSWSTSSSTPTWRGASPRPGHFLIRGVHANYGFVYPLLLSPVYAVVRPDERRLPSGRASERARRCARPSSRRTCSRAASSARPRRSPPPRSPSRSRRLAYVGTLMTENVVLSRSSSGSRSRSSPRSSGRRSREQLAAARALRARVRHARADGRARRGGADRAARPRVDRARAAAAAQGVRAAVRDRRRRRRARRDRRRGRARPLAGARSSATTASRRSGGYHVWPALRVDRAPPRGARPRALRAAVRGADRARRERASSRPPPARLRGRVGVALRVARARGRRCSRRATRSAIEERNLFYLTPLFVIALLAWIERGQPRPPRAAVAAAGVAAALPGAIPFAQPAEHHGAVRHDRPAAVVVRRRRVGRARTASRVVVVALSIALGALFLWLPRRYAPVLPVARRARLPRDVAPARAVDAQLPAARRRARYAQGIGSRTRAGSTRAVGRDADVARALVRRQPALACWENEFWNRSVDRVYDLGAPLPGDMPSTRRRASTRRRGVLAIAGVRSRALRARDRRRCSSSGTRVAADPAKQLVLYRVSRPARDDDAGQRPLPERRSSRGRVRTSTWTALDVHGRHAARAGLERRAALPEHDADGRRRRDDAGADVARSPSTTSDRTFTLPLTPQNGVCQVDFAISPTRRPVDYPTLHRTDTRLLGLHFDTLRLLADAVRIVVDVAPLSHQRTGVGNYIRGSLLGIVEASAGEHELVAFAPASARGKREIESALDGSRRRAPAAGVCRPRTRCARAWSRVGTPPARAVRSARSTSSTSATGCIRRSGPGVRSTMIHDLVPLHFPDWVHARTRRMHGAKYRHAARDVRRRDRQLAVHRRRRRGDARRRPRRGSTSRIPASTPGFTPDGERLGSPAAARTCSPSRRSSRARTSRARRGAPAARPGELALAVVGAARLGRPAGARRAGDRAARLHAARRAARVSTAARARSSTRRSSRASACPSSRRWRAARRASSRRIRRSTRRAAMLPCASTRDDADGDRGGRSSARSPSATSSRRAASRTRAASRGSRTAARTSPRGRPRVNVAVDVTPLAQTRAGTARYLRALLPRLERDGDARAACSGFARGAAGTLWLDLAWYPHVLPHSARGADVLHCPTYRGPVRERASRSSSRCTTSPSSATRRSFPRWTRDVQPRVVPRVAAQRAARRRRLRVHRGRARVACCACRARRSASSRTRSTRSFAPDGPRADGDYVLAVGTLEPRKNLARVDRGGAAARRRAARRRRARLGRASRRAATASPGSARSATTSSRGSTAARSASSTRRSTRASASRCSRRWRAARRSSRPRGGATEEVAGGAAVLVDPLDVGCDRRRHRGGDRAARRAARARPRARARVLVGRVGPRHARGLPRGRGMSDPLVVDRRRRARPAAHRRRDVRRELLRALPAVADGLASRRSRGGPTSSRRASSRSSCRRASRSCGWRCACRCCCAACVRRSRTSSTRCRSRCRAPRVLTVQDLSFERDRSLMGARETAIFRIVVPRSARRARARARDLAADEGRSRRALRTPRRRRSS